MLVKRLLKQGLFLRNAAIPKQRPQIAAYHALKEEWKGAGMNDLPIPEGDWAEDYAKRNMGYNIFMYSGIITFVLVIFAGVKSNVLFYNYFPPLHYDADKDAR